MADWRFKLAKLKNVILSSVDPSEAPPGFLEWISLHLKINRKQLSIEDIADDEHDELKFDNFVEGFADMQFIWEPLSDAVGRPTDHYGWNVDLTMYANNGVAHWLAVASFAKKQLTAGDLDSIARAIRQMGGDPEADLVTIIPGDTSGKWQRWYTWKNHDELLDLHVMKFTPTGDEQRDAMLVASNMKLVPRGSDVLAGYTLMPAMASIVARESD